MPSLTDADTSPNLQTQELVMMMLGMYLEPRSRTVWSGGLVRLLGELGLSAAAARAALARLVNRDLLARSHQGRSTYYTLTSRGRDLLEKSENGFSSPVSWPTGIDRWTVLWHAITDERRSERTRLSRRLRSLGFRSLQDAVWISPHDRGEEAIRLIGDLALEPLCGVMIGEVPEDLNPDRLVSRLWPAEEISDRYRG
ncbi:MAG: PaaX family transcriptional regulator, partial [Actinobacteria bacterium]|nr:PaaX family transcriptional regulator [Actinomycetota bacterium]